MPANCAIDEEISFGMDDFSPKESSNTPLGDETTSTRGTNSFSISARRSSSRTEKGMERVMVGFTEASQEANAIVRKMISMF